MQKFFGIVGLTSFLFFLNISSVSAEGIVVTASRLAQHGYKIASNVTVIDQEEISQYNAQNIGEVLKMQPGVHMYDTSTSKTQVIDIRGFGDTASRNSLVLVNDRRINPIDVSAPDIMHIPLNSVERIEVIRGGGSVLYGDNAVGGVVNIITKEGKGPISGSLSSLGGSYKTSGVAFEVSGSEGFDSAGLENDVSYFFSGKYHDTGGFRKNSTVLNKDYNSRLGYKVSDVLSVAVNTGLHEDRYGLPGGMTQAELDSLGRKGSANQEDYAKTRDSFVQLVFDVNPWPEDSDWGNFVFDLGYRNRDTFTHFGVFTFDTKRSIDAYNFNTKYVFDHTLFDREVNFVTGIDYYNTDNFIQGGGFNTDRLTISKEEVGAYVFAEAEVLPSTFLSGGTRFQQADYTFDQAASVRSYNTQSPSESVNSVGLKYEYGEGSNVFVSAEQTFRYLATDEWYSSFTGTLSTDLKQQTGELYEVGVKQNLGDMAQVSVSGYWMDNDNEIFYNPESGFFGSNDNYDKTRRMGLEIGQTLDVLKVLPTELVNRLDFFTNYTLQNPEFLDGANDGKNIPFVPEHKATLGMTAGFLEHFLMSLTGNYVGSRFAINDTANETPKEKPYFTLGWKLSYIRRNLEMFFGLNNITNEKYNSYVVKAVGSSVKDFYPAPERHFLAGFKLKF